MSVLTNINTQNIIDKSDLQKNPFSIILKNSSWYIFNKNGRIIIREYNSVNGYKITDDNFTYFTISNYIDSTTGVVSEDKFMLWLVDDDNLYYYVVEPISGEFSLVSNKELFLTDVSLAFISVNTFDQLDIITLFYNADFGERLNYKRYKRDLLVSVVDVDLPWGDLYTNSGLGFYNIPTDNRMLLSTLRTSSPESVYLDVFSTIINTIYNVDGEVTGTSNIISNILRTSNNISKYLREKFIGLGNGSPGVRIKLNDFSSNITGSILTSIGGIVGNASKGEFNKIHKISSTSQLEEVLGSGFSNYRLNQSYYAARAIINNGGTVEFIRPYSEEIDPDSTDKRELKTDVYLIKYDFSPTSVRNFNINNYAATRLADDAYQIHGNRIINNISEVYLSGVNYNFSLNSPLSGTEIPLISIINDNPELSKRGSNRFDQSSDLISVTSASYNKTTSVEQRISFSSQPSDGDIIYIYDHTGTQISFEFDSDNIVNPGNIQVSIESTLNSTLTNLLSLLKTNLPYFTFNKNGYDITGKNFFGINDVYNSSIHQNIFNELIDSSNSISIDTSVVNELNILKDNTIGKIFNELGLSNEVFIKNSYNSNSEKSYSLTSTGLSVSKLFLLVDYYYNGELYTFYGTIIPYAYNTSDLYILNSANAVKNGFSVFVNEHSDLVSSTENVNFNLSQLKSPIIVDAISTGNIILSGLQIVDGVTLLEDDKVLVKNQVDPRFNGIYLVKPGSWVRSEDLDNPDEVTSDIFVTSNNGAINQNKIFKISVPVENVILNYHEINFYETTELPITTSLKKYAYDLTDPAIINNAIWEYNYNTLTSTDIANAWKMFQSCSDSNVDFLISAGSCIKNLFKRGLEELDAEVIDAMLTVCELRKNCFAILDGVDEKNIDNAIIKMGGISGSLGEKSRWGAIFDGRSIFDDTIYTKMEAESVKSIELAGLITRNRRGGQFWIPPAGRDYGTVPVSLSKRMKYTRTYNNPEDVNSDVSRLYELHINSSRSINGLTTIYGQKTLSRRNDYFTRLNVSMLVAGINKIFKNVLNSRMLKLNTLALRSTIREQLFLILNNIKSANPSGLNAFFITCDNSNNNIETIKAGKLIVDVKIYPTTSAEYITLRTTVLNTGNSLNLGEISII